MTEDDQRALIAVRELIARKPELMGDVVLAAVAGQALALINAQAALAVKDTAMLAALALCDPGTRVTKETREALGAVILKALPAKDTEAPIERKTRERLS